MIDKDYDIKLNFSRAHTKYCRHDGRFKDTDVEFNDFINLLVPPNPKPSNCYLFELIMLASDFQPKDYVVGWGVFPAVDSQFQINEGKFKVPMLFGNVNSKFDKYDRMEEFVKTDLDGWIGNLYFQVERMQISDIKTDSQTGELYYSPLSSTAINRLKTTMSRAGSRQHTAQKSLKGSVGSD